eukprot:10885589-Lingulodinium_polyedra.AAC.1
MTSKGSPRRRQSARKEGRDRPSELLAISLSMPAVHGLHARHQATPGVLPEAECQTMGPNVEVAGPAAMLDRAVVVASLLGGALRAAREEPQHVGGGVEGGAPPPSPADP